MKRLSTFILCAALLLGLLCGCAPAPAVPTTEATTVPTTEETTPIEEVSPMKLLIIGNSHSIDAFHFLYQAFRDQMPGQEVVLGVLHYSGCAISTHLQFARYNKPVYTYFRNTFGDWVITEGVTMEAVLKDQDWNMVMFQAAKTDLDETLNAPDRRLLEQFVSQYLSADHRFLWHTSWPSPNDETFFSPDYLHPAPDGYKENLQKLYGFDPVRQFTVLTDAAKAHILTDPHYEKAVCTGAAIMYAHFELGIPQTRIWRDYTHLSDYGRLIAAYAMYAQLTGKPVYEIGIDRISVYQRHFLYQQLGDLPITNAMKRVIVRSANHALNDPWSVPGK